MPTTFRSVSPLRWLAACGLAATLLFAHGCAKRLERTLVEPRAAATLDGASPFLKIHRADGGLWVLSDWEVDGARSAVSGNGERFDANREIVAQGSFTVPMDSVALFETNVLERSPANTALAVMTGVTAAVAGICAINPKTCFGSCPTFYAPDADGSFVLQAEGFSSSIAPALEATDRDLLLHARPSSRDFRLRVTNEALETHVIRWADLLAVPRPVDGRAFPTSDGRFLEVASVVGPSVCRDARGDCRAAVAEADGQERWSPADSADLATREVVELEFQEVPDGALGLVVVSRQTLLTTFLIYQALAYLGEDAGRYLASLGADGSGALEGAGAMGRLLGDIQVLAEDPSGDWVEVGSVGETGPIAADTRVLPLDPAGAAPGEPLRLRLRLTRGMWRVDQVALASLGAAVEPRRLRPVEVHGDEGYDAAALEALLDPEETLVTLPGDAYELAYRLPESPERYDYVLEARGYYLEWMRQEWLAEQDPWRAAQLVLDPAEALRELAPAFKAVEPEIERLFWSSRYVPER